jgi:hypothetical protein
VLCRVKCDPHSLNTGKNHTIVLTWKTISVRFSGVREVTDIVRLLQSVFTTSMAFNELHGVNYCWKNLVISLIENVSVVMDPYYSSSFSQMPTTETISEPVEPGQNAISLLSILTLSSNVRLGFPCCL